MIRRTSAVVYREITDSGLLSKRRLEVYKYLYHHGPLTGAQISVALKRADSVSETVRNRITELVKMGAVFEVKEVECPITRRNVMQFDVTDKIPKDYEKPKSKDEIIKDLKNENTILKARIVRLVHRIRKDG